MAYDQHSHDFLVGAWAGRRVALWHGDTAASQRKSMLTDPPDLLLTTPEALSSTFSPTPFPSSRTLSRETK